MENKRRNRLKKTLYFLVTENSLLILIDILGEIGRNGSVICIGSLGLIDRNSLVIHPYFINTKKTISLALMLKGYCLLNCLKFY